MPVTINGTSGITTPGIDASGTNKFATTIGVGGATPSASGAGITFPATQSASSDANTLDDYEEGTWTPTVQGSSTAGTCTYGFRIGYYTRVGRLVNVTCRVSWSGHTGTGNLLITGLPFTSVSAIDSVGAMMITNATFSSSATSVSGYLGSSGTNVIPWGSGNGAPWGPFQVSAAVDTIFNVSYTV